MILEGFKTNPNYSTTGLALILLFQTGLRSDEAVSLKPTDIKGDYLTIERTERSYSSINTNGISNDEVRKIAGYSDLTVTNSCYVYNRNPASQTLYVLNEVL